MANAPTLYLVVSGAPVPEGATGLVELLLNDGYQVLVLSTPNGTRFHDTGRLAELTGEQVRVEYRMPGTGKSLPPADAVLACPLTFNSTNKFAVGLLCEMVGYDVPTIVVPHCKPQLASHPAFQRSLATLRSIPAVTLLHDPHAPYDQRLPNWEQALQAVRSATPTS
ncbi:flavoprotein [Nocardiopsis baichengensis]|uniref:flavoprotein n=1 Tax=Nocardiopsis baichengensis TaxID=280240 RepID=UPI0003633CEE|nr:flavoprotein [Nocardiopsis baichengensis]